MSPTLRSDLLPTLCTYLPETDAHWIRSCDPSDYLTHVEAYASVRRNGITLPTQLLRDFASGLVRYLEGPGDTAAAS
ncbi:MAG: hypothetical protein ACJ72D_23440 [Marmoricola sp.]